MRQTQSNSLFRGSPQGISAPHARAEASPCREQALGGPGIRRLPGQGRGFTVVELLVVIAIIIVLLSILIVAVNAATRTGQRTRTSSLMTNMTSALVRFREDHGYYPPLLGPASGASTVADDFRALLFPPDPEDASFEDDLQDWWSVTSLAEFLIGYGTAAQDGHAGPGLRNPGPDGVWGATANTGALVDRLPPTQGKVSSSYLEIDEKRLLGSINGTVDAATGRLNVFFPGEGNYNADDPKVIVDYWGNPLRYYRQVYREGVLTQPWRDASGATAAPTLSDVILLRPWELKVGTDTDSSIGDASAPSDTTTSISLRTAEFAIFSPGQDRRQDHTRRRDPDEFNADNIIVEGGS